MSRGPAKRARFGGSERRNYLDMTRSYGHRGFIKVDQGGYDPGMFRGLDRDQAKEVGESIRGSCIRLRTKEGLLGKDSRPLHGAMNLRALSLEQVAGNSKIDCRLVMTYLEPI